MSESTREDDDAEARWSAIHEDRPEDMRSDLGQDSWVDALVTLLATVLFGLGWALVELERADPPLGGYARTASESWVATVATSAENRVQIEDRTAGAVLDARWGDKHPRWIELALQRSNR